MKTLLNSARRSRSFRLGTLAAGCNGGCHSAERQRVLTTPQSKRQAAFRKEFTAYLTEMQQVTVMPRRPREAVPPSPSSDWNPRACLPGRAWKSRG